MTNTFLAMQLAWIDKDFLTPLRMINYESCICESSKSSEKGLKALW